MQVLPFYLGLERRFDEGNFSVVKRVIYYGNVVVFVEKVWLRYTKNLPISYVFIFKFKI